MYLYIMIGFILMLVTNIRSYESQTRKTLIVTVYIIIQSISFRLVLGVSCPAVINVAAGQGFLHALINTAHFDTTILEFQYKKLLIYDSKIL